MNILGIILSALLSGGLAFFLAYIRSSQGLTSRLAKKLEELNRKELEVKSLEEQAHFAYTRATEFNAQISCLNNEIQAKTEQLNQISEGVMKAEDTIRTRLKKERKEWYEQYCAEQQEELQQAARDFTEQFKSDNSVKLIAAQELQDQIEQLRSSVASAVEIAKHKMEEENKVEFYRLQLPEASVKDIQALRSIESLLSNAETINKVIWKSYYERPYTDLIGRLSLSNSAVCGIYKITNIENEMTYIGQAVNIAERWKQHIKRGIGAETPINNKLYPAMKQFGPENFTFEIVEVCPRSKLNEREDYWQEFYKAKEFGYSMK